MGADKHRDPCIFTDEANEAGEQSHAAGSAQPGSGGQTYAAVRRCHVGMRIAHTPVLRKQRADNYISRTVPQLKAKVLAFKGRTELTNEPFVMRS